MPITNRSRIRRREVIREAPVAGTDVDGRARVPARISAKSAAGEPVVRPLPITRVIVIGVSALAAEREHAFVRLVAADAGQHAERLRQRRRRHTLREQRAQQVVELPVGRDSRRRIGPIASDRRRDHERALAEQLLAARSRPPAPPRAPNRNSSKVFVTSRPRHTRQSGHTAATSASVSASRGAAS